MKFIPLKMLGLKKIEVLKCGSFLHDFVAYNSEYEHHALPKQAESTNLLLSFVVTSLRTLELQLSLRLAVIVIWRIGGWIILC